MSGRPIAGDPGIDPPWAEDEDLYTDDERSSSYPPDSLVTLRFLWAAIRRQARLWIAIAVAGLIGGLALPVVMPPPSESAVRILLTHRDGDDPLRSMATDAGMAVTQSVAQRTIDRLKLDEAPDDLLKRYTVEPLTDRVLEIRAFAGSPEESTRLAETLANTYLAFRRDQVSLQLVPLRKDLAAARSAVTEAEADIRAAGGDPGDPDPPASAEKTRLDRARTRQAYIEQQILDQEVAAARMSSSRVLDKAAVVPKSAKRALVINVGSGLFAGLVLGIGFIVVRALISDRLWRRQDIARAIGSRVGLSIRRPPPWRSLAFAPYLRRSQRERPEVQLAVRHLRDNLVWGETPKAALAVVSVDNVRDSAILVGSLALTLAEEGRQVLVADLTDSAGLAAALGVGTPGTHESWSEDSEARVMVHQPVPGSPPATGRRRRSVDPGSADDALDEAWARADVVLTLATLTPALGAEHLRTWASRASAVVTAGRSSATKLHTAGEMVRLAGLRLGSVILLGADRSDDTLGSPEAAERAGR